LVEINGTADESRSLGHEHSSVNIIYRVIKKSLCTWWLHC